ncbi:phospholipid:lipid A palmitoyltransferase, partial [Vibrio cholerae]|nr:phospholipid:lipid A palmitoyltransferase [Vibrio cholerae]
MRHFLTGLGLLLLLSTASAQATSSATPTEQNPHWWNTFTNNIVQTWEEPQHYDLYLPFLSWHNRWLYDETDH